MAVSTVRGSSKARLKYYSTKVLLALIQVVPCYPGKRHVICGFGLVQMFLKKPGRSFPGIFCRLWPIH
jgi:hypothetical protein